MTDRVLYSLHEALGTAMDIAELRRGLELLTQALDASAADYFRFPRYAGGPLGHAVLALRSGPSGWTKPVNLPEPIAELPVWIAPLTHLQFGERDAAGVAVSGKSISPKAFAEYLPPFQAAHERIVRFASVTGQNVGLTSLIEQRLSACAVLATRQGVVLWMSESAREVLGEQGVEALQNRLRESLAAIVKGGARAKERQFALTLPGNKSRLFGAMSFVRESPQTSVHYVAVELFGSDVESNNDEAKLTPSEREVYRLVKQGLSNEQIAAERFTSLETARTHVKSVYRKLGVSSRVELLSRRQPTDEQDK